MCQESYGIPECVIKLERSFKLEPAASVQHVMEVLGSLACSLGCFSVGYMEPVHNVILNGSNNFGRAFGRILFHLFIIFSQK